MHFIVYNVNFSFSFEDRRTIEENDLEHTFHVSIYVYICLYVNDRDL